MPKRWPRIRPYRSRGRPPKHQEKGLELTKQMLHDLKHRFNTDVESLIAFAEQGNRDLLSTNRMKLKRDLLKYGGEMEKIAMRLGTKAVRYTRTFLDSLNEILHTESLWLDREKTQNFYKAVEQLESFLRAA